MLEIIRVYYSIFILAVLMFHLSEGGIKYQEGNTGKFAIVPYDNTRIAELGHLKEDIKEYNKKDGSYMGRVESKKLVLDGTEEGSSKINKFIDDRFNEETKMINEFLTVYGAEGDEPLFEFTMEMGDISYMDENYCCIGIIGFHNFGGAHGLKFMEYYVFNRNTGEQLQLQDIVGNSVEEFRKIIRKAFTEVEEGTTLKLPEETIDNIAKKANLQNMKFYLTGQGVYFYFAPYEVTSYIGGFPEALVPYEQLEMKINITN